MSFEPRDYLRHILVEADYVIGRSASLGFEQFVADGQPFGQRRRGFSSLGRRRLERARRSGGNPGESARRNLDDRRRTFPFGLRSELQREARERGTGCQFRVEVNMQYRSRWLELLMVHQADHGSLPSDNAKDPPPNLGRLSPA